MVQGTMARVARPQADYGLSLPPHPHVPSKLRGRHCRHKNVPPQTTAFAQGPGNSSSSEGFPGTRQVTTSSESPLEQVSRSMTANQQGPDESRILTMLSKYNGLNLEQMHQLWTKENARWEHVLDQAQKLHAMQCHAGVNWVAQHASPAA
jgi:hypothetical protein